MGEYDAVSWRLITHCDEIFPFRAFLVPRNWVKIDEVLSHIPLEGERLMSSEEVLYFYE